MLTNVQIEEAIKSGSIKITPYNGALLDINNYRLKPRYIKISKFDSDGLLIEKTMDLKNKYILEPHEYVVVSIEEKIILAERFFGRFFPASICIEKGLIITCGHLNSNYSKEIRFGLFNAKNDECKIDSDLDVARIEFEKIDENIPIRYGNNYSDNYTEIISRLRSEKEELKGDYEKKVKQIDQKIKEYSIL